MKEQTSVGDDMRQKHRVEASSVQVKDGNERQGGASGERNIVERIRRDRSRAVRNNGMTKREKFSF